MALATAQASYGSFHYDALPYHGMTYKSVAMTSWTPKDAHGQFSMSFEKKPPTAGKIKYLQSAKELNTNVLQRYGGTRVGLGRPQSETSSAYPFRHPEISRPSSAELLQLYEELAAPVEYKTTAPSEGPIPDFLSRSREEHRPRSRAATAQHRLRTRITSKHIPPSAGSSIASSMASIVVPRAEGDTALTQTSHIYLREGGGGRKVVALKYGTDSAAEADAPAAEQPPAAASRWPEPRYTMGTSTSFRPRTAEEYSHRVIAPLNTTGQLDRMRQPAPDYLRPPAHPRTQLFVWQKGTPMQLGEPSTAVRPSTSSSGARPDYYVLVSDDFEKGGFQRVTRSR